MAAGRRDLVEISHCAYIGTGRSGQPPNDRRRKAPGRAIQLPPGGSFYSWRRWPGFGSPKESPGRAQYRQGSSLAGGMLVTAHPKSITVRAWPSARIATRRCRSSTASIAAARRRVRGSRRGANFKRGMRTPLHDSTQSAGLSRDRGSLGGSHVDRGQGADRAGVDNPDVAAGHARGRGLSVGMDGQLEQPRERRLHRRR